MKRFLLLTLALALAACFPGNALTAQRLDPKTVQASATQGPTLNAAAALSFEDSEWSASVEGACKRASVGGNPKRGLICAVPKGGLLVTIKTAGAVTFQLLDGLKPVTAPVVIK